MAPLARAQQEVDAGSGGPFAGVAPPIIAALAAIKALGGPFGEVKFCPTGGVSPANIKSYMALKNVMCVGGSWMLDPEWIKNGDWGRIQECTAEALALLD